jgi:antirestriction protein ArdC
MSVYDEITQAIVAELEKGVPPWVKSWSSLEGIAGKVYLVSSKTVFSTHQ